MNILKKIWQFLNRYKIATLIILGLILLRLIISFSKDIKEEYRELPAAEFTQKTFTKSNTTGGLVTVNYPITGTKDVDAIILSQVESLSENALISNTKETYNSQPYSFKQYTFVGFQNTNLQTKAPTYATVLMDKHKIVPITDFITGNYIVPFTSYISNQITQTYPNAKIDKLGTALEDSLKNNNARMASNGLIIAIPTRSIPGLMYPGAYYEVLIPTNVIEPYLK